jgi:4-amino-4-deoxy-L-arabinose transferase-like glycosyltransferase
MSTSSVIEAVASRTNVRCHPEEDYTDYFDRLGATHDVDESDRERLESLAEKELFAPDPALSDAERREIREICDRLLGPEATETVEAQNAKASVADTAVESSSTEQPDSFEHVHNDGSTAPMSETEVFRRSSHPSTPGASGIRQYLKHVGTRADVVYLLPLLACGVFMFFYGLGVSPLLPMDEGFYANLARHMVQDGYWVVPHMHYRIGIAPSNFEPWLRLPPLGIWLQALSMLALGVNEFAARLPSAAAGVLTVAVVYLVGRDIQSRRAGFVAGVVYLTTPHIYAFNGGREAALDSLLVLFGSLFVFTTWLAVSRNERRWLYPMGLFAGLAVLTKGFGAGVFLIVVLPLVFFAQRVFVSKEMGLAVGLTGLLTFPWPIYIYSRFGDAFVQEFFVRYVVDRATGAAFGANTNTLFSFMEYPYITGLLFSPDLFHPWSFILAIGIPVYAYQRFTTDDRGSVLKAGFLIWWIVATFGLFVFIGNKVWYIFPVYVPAAVLIGALVDEAVAGRTVEGIAVALGAGLLLIVSPAFSLTTTPRELVAPGVVFTAGVVLVLWVAPIRERLSERLPTSVSSVFSGVAPLVIAIIIVGSFVGVPQTSAESPQRVLAEELNQQSPEPELVFIESEMERPFHTFSFSAQRPLESGPASELDSSEARYAVLTIESLSEVDADTRVIMFATISGNQRVCLVEVQR